VGAIRKAPLFRKVLVATIALFATVAIAISILSAWQLNRSLTSEFLSKGTAIATSIATSSVELLLTRDGATLQSTVDQFLEIRGVAYVFVIDDQREIVSHTFVPVVPDVIRQLAASRPASVSDAVQVEDVVVPGGGEYFDIAAPILAGVVGTAHVGMDKAVIAGDVRSALLEQQGILLALFLASLAVAYWFVNRTARPLEALTGYVHRMAGSDFTALEPEPQIERIAEGSGDEVGELARAFRTMAATLKGYIDDLRRARDELAEHNRTLEGRVAQRTEELVGKNRDLEQALDRLRAAQEQMLTQEKLASLGALTAGIAHEIKNPLNFVINFAQVSTELTAELREAVTGAVPPEQAAELLDVCEMLEMNARKIAEHGQRADGIVRNMLLHSRGRPGERVGVDLNALLTEDVGLAYHGMRGQDRTFNAKMDLQLAPDLGEIMAVPQDLSRAFLNILTNACYALRERQQSDGAGFHPVLTVSTRRTETAVEIRIRDNGPGITPDVRQKMFEPFFTTKPAGSGTGLGLSLTYDIIRSHRGTIGVESEPGVFTEFLITLSSEEISE
jgi:signal transduction histidine kinase